MAITNRGLMAAGGGLTVDPYPVTEYSRTYRVHSTNLVTEDETAVLAWMVAHGFAPGTAHPHDARARILRLSARIAQRYTEGDDRGLTWDVTVDYGPYSPLEKGSPLEQPVRFRLDPQVVEEPIYRDKDGVPVVNSAGDPFDPPVTQEVTQYLLTVTRNEVDTDLVALLLLSGRPKVNDAVWNGFPQRTVKLLPLKIPERSYSQDDNTYFFAMEYVFHIDFDTWDKLVLNQGLGELYTSGGVTKRRAILDGSGQPATVPVLLDGFGHKLAQPIDASNIVVLNFSVFEEIDFGQFGLDGLFTDLYTP